jgi:hypothetical protein
MRYRSDRYLFVLGGLLLVVNFDQRKQQMVRLIEVDRQLELQLPKQ